MFHPDRFVDDGTFLLSYASEVLVKCARCTMPGAVRAEWSGWQWMAVFECGDCGLQLESSKGDWLGPIRWAGRRPCGYCGHKWLLPQIDQVGWPREVFDSVSSSCAECGRESIVPLQPHRRYDAGSNIDPHFGQPLLLVDAGRFGSVWAYNGEHLATLKAYVSATLRERGANAGNKSMFSRLPAWMKAAKNRESISKRLAKLERLLPKDSA
jgi:DNA-directed RNA polymerase subunit RPC12/RpoP